MSEGTVITARGLGKRYRIWTHSKPTTLAERLHTVGAHARHRARKQEAPPLREVIWALRDVSFDVRRGEVLGVIGPNGAGKSTLLSILARITEPTEGEAEIHGRISSLLEVGTGFHPELSGRDNVFLNGAILGMTRRETAEKYDEIVDFSGVRDFIDMPVKRYSSGMYVRLAFAIAAHLDPEVLLLDEVLSVGDRAFQAKCLHRIDDLTQSGRTVIFVSHDTSAVARLCHRAIVVNEGRIAYDGEVEDAIECYMGATTLDGGASAAEEAALHREGTGAVRVAGVRVTDLDGRPWVRPDRPVAIQIDLTALEPVDASDLDLEVGIWSPVTGQPITLATRLEAENPLEGLELDGTTTVAVVLDELPLRPTRYNISVSVDHRGTVLDRFPDATRFTLRPGDFYGTGNPIGDNYPSAVLVRHQWRVEAAAGAPRR